MPGPPQAKQSWMDLPAPGGPKAPGSVAVAAQLTGLQSKCDTSRLVRHAARLHAGLQRMGNNAAVSLHTRFSVLVRRPFVQDIQTSSIWTNLYSSLKAERFPAVSSRRAATLGELAGLLDGPGPTAAGTHTQLCEPYQEDTTAELLPKNDKIESTNPRPISWGEEKDVWVKVKPSNTPHRCLLLVHIQSLPSFSNLSIHHFQPACSSCALSYSFFFWFPLPLRLCRLQLLLYTPVP